MQKENPEEKAWNYLRELMKDDEKWKSLKDGKFVEVTGSEGGKYILYPTGRVVRLDDKDAKLGWVSNHRYLPFPDVLCTVYAWITQDEAEFLSRWNCGNIAIGDEIEEDDEDYTVLSRYVGVGRRNVNPFSVMTTIVGLAMGIILAVILTGQLSAVANEGFVNSDFVTSVMMVMPLLMVAFVAFWVIINIGKRW